jgi:uncharacterized protein (TIGR03435 family)
MNSPMEWHTGWTAALACHLWQSTLSFVVLWLLTLLLRRNHARMRFRLWMLASVKFLVPFALLIAAGERLQPASHSTAVAPVFAIFMEGPVEIPSKEKPVQATLAATQQDAIASPAEVKKYLLPRLLIGIWATGTLVCLGDWARRWRNIRVLVGNGSPLEDLRGVRVVSVASSAEPGIFGLVRPVLLLPKGIAERLTPAQLKAILEHELCHVRRRDNLSAALHMLISAVFWFHPLIWWIGSRLLEEREAACDEAVLEANNPPLSYAEGILNVCKFYVEEPMACVSGVTGADLKKRVARILSDQMAVKLDVTRKLLLSAAGALAIAAPIAFGVLHASKAYGQAAARTNIDDTWQGTLHAQKDLRTVLKITKVQDGTLKGSFYSIDQGGQSIPIKQITFQAGELKLNIEAIDGTYVGKLSPDGTTITGEWKQGDNARQLILLRAMPDTAWTIPEPPPKMPPMAADADPSFEVATIKPSDPNSKGKGFGGPPGHFQTHNTTLNDLIMFAYSVHTKQLVGGPEWLGSEKFDIVTKPDTPGAPNEQQTKLMMRKLLVSRFGLKFHEEKKEMSAYVLTVAKGGPKLAKSEADPNTPSAFFFTKLGNLTIRNITMDGFVHWMQTVLDRPMVDHTELQGHFDGTLKWTPDETQFAVFGVKIVPSDAADAPPDLYKAIQEQIGLKLDAAKTNVDVMVLDHVEKPSEN